jgi:predicted nucleic acid-binding protein
LHGSQNFEVFTSPLCLAIAFYFAEKKSGSREAFKKIKILADRLSITHAGPEETRLAANLKSCTDFEDALQYQSAIGSGCRALVTYDSQDFYFANIPVLEPMAFFRQFVFNSKR